MRGHDFYQIALLRESHDYFSLVDNSSNSGRSRPFSIIASMHMTSFCVSILIVKDKLGKILTLQNKPKSCLLSSKVDVPKCE